MKTVLDINLRMIMTVVGIFYEKSSGNCTQIRLPPGEASKLASSRGHGGQKIKMLLKNLMNIQWIIASLIALHRTALCQWHYYLRLVLKVSAEGRNLCGFSPGPEEGNYAKFLWPFSVASSPLPLRGYVLYQVVSITQRLPQNLPIDSSIAQIPEHTETYWRFTYRG